MVAVYLGLGSNQGDREANLRRARELLGTVPGLVLRRSSGIYLTEPVGMKDQPWFLNQVCAGDSFLGAPALLSVCKSIERIMGRTPGERWGPRIIDVDILLYGQKIIKRHDLQVPHRGLWGRAFVLIPLAEIAPGLILPDGQRVKELAEQKFSEVVLPWRVEPC